MILNISEILNTLCKIAANGFTFKSEAPVTTVSEDYVGIEGKPFTFPSHVTDKPALDMHWYLNGRYTSF